MPTPYTTDHLFPWTEGWQFFHRTLIFTVQCHQPTGFKTSQVAEFITFLSIIRLVNTDGQRVNTLKTSWHHFFSVACVLVSLFLDFGHILMADTSRGGRKSSDGKQGDPQTFWPIIFHSFPWLRVFFLICWDYIHQEQYLKLSITRKKGTTVQRFEVSEIMFLKKVFFSCSRLHWLDTYIVKID